MSNAKSAIMVPIVTLAVCAIAMVGLGFALTTSVVSDLNKVSVFQIDLSDDESTLSGAKAVTNGHVNNVLDLTMTSHKTSDGGLTYDYDGFTYMKIFSNTTGYNDHPVLTVSYTDSSSTVSSVVIQLYSGANYSNAVGNAVTITGGSTGSSFVPLDINTVYKVSIIGVSSSTIIGIDNAVKLSFTFNADMQKTVAEST